MAALDTGEERLNKIAQALRKETLEPAEQEAARIVEKAREEAEALRAAARREVETMESHAKQQIEKERAVFHTALQQAAKQALEALRQEIEHKLVREPLGAEIAQASAEPGAIAKLLDAIVEAVKREGTAAELQAIIPKAVDPEAVLRSLNWKGDLQKGVFAGGVQLKLVDQRITIDLSDATLHEMLVRYLRADFREKFFQG